MHSILVNMDYSDYMGEEQLFSDASVDSMDQIIHNIVELADSIYEEKGLYYEDLPWNSAQMVSPCQSELDWAVKTCADQQTFAELNNVEPIREDSWLELTSEGQFSPYSQLAEQLSLSAEEPVSPTPPQDIFAKAEEDAMDSADGDDSDASDPDWGCRRPRRKRQPKRLTPRKTRTVTRRRYSGSSSNSSCPSLTSSSPPASPFAAEECRAPRAKITVWLAKLLHNPSFNPSVMRWENEKEGIFRITDQEELAKLWGEAKSNPTMTYEKLSRAMRYYYDRKELIIVHKKMIYQFGPRALWTRAQLTAANLD